MSGWLSFIRFRCSTTIILLVLAGCAFGAAPDIKSLPQPTGYVSDLAHVVNAADKDKLEAFCTRIEQQLGVQLALVTIDTIGDTPIENFSLELSRAWGVGAKKDNQGVLLLLAVKDHKSRLEIGRGVEPYVTDGFSGSTLRAMRTDLRDGDYGSALMSGARQIAAQISAGKGVAFDGGDGVPPRMDNVDDRSSRRGLSPLQIIIGIVVVLFLLRLFSRGGRGGGYRGGGGGGGFLTGFLLSSLLNSGRGNSGGWGGGGGFGGGDSGGGGGFGGFGGGDFGGGGASSDW